ncbi:MAG: hypothetical protein JW945_05955 [Methanomicrobia archaeon]|nr:hypothetical protein [Methanomicrobia archaeon]
MTRRSARHLAGKETPAEPPSSSRASRPIFTAGFFGMSSKELVIFLLAFLALSIVFLALWYYIGAYYQAAVFFVAKYILLALGYSYEQIAGMDFTGAYLVNFNLVPLFALALATPRLSLRQRLAMLAIGVPLLFVIHVLDIVAHLPHFIELYYQHRIGFATLIVDSLGVIGLAIAFGIWVLICYRAFLSDQKTV